MYADAFCANRHFAFMLSGVGMDARVAARFANSRRRGFFTYMTETFREFFLAKTHHFRICIDQFEFETDAYFVSVANGNQFGNNVTIAPLATMDDGRLDVVVVQQMPKLFLFGALLRQLKATNYQPLGRGKPPKGTLLYFKGRDITIYNPTKAPLHVDGDPEETAEKIAFHVRPGTIRLLVPLSQVQ
jgi:diacylglycerol kinase family enzyme